MRLHFLLLLFFLTALYSKAQTGIVASLQHASKNELKTADSVISFIRKHSSNEQEKALGVYYYVATHVKYDIKKFIKDKPSFSEPSEVFKKEKAVCIGYSQLYQYLCIGLGLECEVVAGYSKGFRYKNGQSFVLSDHAWNAVKIDSVWQLVDVTWASGSAKKKLFGYKVIPHYSRDFFEVSPGTFVLKHLPEAPMWQLLDNPVPMKEYVAGDKKVQTFLSSTPSKVFHFQDSIRLYLQLDTLKGKLLYGDMVYHFNRANTLPLAQAIMVSIGTKVLSDSLLDGNFTYAPIDSLIHENQRAIGLLKKIQKSDRKSVTALVNRMLYNSTALLGGLYYINAKMLDRRLDVAQQSFDSVLFISKPLLQSLENGVITYRETNNARLINMMEQQLGIQYLKSLKLYYSFLKEEKTESNQKLIQKEMLAIKKNAKKYISANQSSYKAIEAFSLKVE